MLIMKFILALLPVIVITILTITIIVTTIIKHF